MCKRGKGGILLVNSGACYGGIRGPSAYTGSKGFMLNFAQAIWGELQPKGVDLLTLVLGQTDTPAYRKLLAEKNLPLPEHWATPEAVAELGLARLPFGPIQNWGQAGDDTGFSPSAAAARRQRVLISRACKGGRGIDLASCIGARIALAGDFGIMPRRDRVGATFSRTLANASREKSRDKGEMRCHWTAAAATGGNAR